MRSSYLLGLKPKEYYYHSVVGRENLIDTSVKSVTGDTPIIIMENGLSKYVKIGEWIKLTFTCTIRNFSATYSNLTY